MSMTSNNPVLKGAFDSPSAGSTISSDAPTEVMSFNGVVNKTAVLLSLVMLFSALTWKGLQSGIIGEGFLFPVMILGIIAQLILTVLIIRKPHLAKTMSVSYAIIEGLFIGAISLHYEMRYPGIVFNAMILTLMAVLGMLFLYRTKIIRATENFKLMIGAATIAIALTYMTSFILSLFGMPMALLHESSPVGIFINAVILGVAVFNLVLDFDQIEIGVENRAPASMEWYCSFGLLVTIMWIYIEILRLLGKVNKK